MDQSWKFLFLTPAALVSPAYAHDYLSTEQAQKILFPQAEAFEKKIIVLSDEQREQIKKRSGVRQRSAHPQVWKAQKKDQLVGWVLLDEVIGKHEYITYAAGISPEGHIVGVEILSYRETHGGEVRKDSWRSRFKNKTLADPFKLDQDIPNISGATLSCRNLTDGVKRLLVLHQLVLSNG